MAKSVIAKAYHYLKNKQKSDSTQVFCVSLNITECSLTETNDKIAVTVYNPIARPVEHYLRVAVRDGKYSVYDSNGQSVTRVSLLSVSDAVKRLPNRFRYADLERALPAVSRPTIARALRELRAEGVVRCLKPGRDATWEKRSQE